MEGKVWCSLGGARGAPVGERPFPQGWSRRTDDESLSRSSYSHCKRTVRLKQQGPLLLPGQAAEGRPSAPGLREARSVRSAPAGGEKRHKGGGFCLVAPPVIGAASDSELKCEKRGIQPSEGSATRKRFNHLATAPSTGLAPVEGAFSNQKAVLIHRSPPPGLSRRSAVSTVATALHRGKPGGGGGGNGDPLLVAKRRPTGTSPVEAAEASPPALIAKRPSTGTSPVERRRLPLLPFRKFRKG